MMIDLDEVQAYIESQPIGTKVYVGCDSEKVKKIFADYVLVIVVHIAGNKGCKIFGEVQRERVYDKGNKSQRLRLMNEVYKASELFLKLAEYIDVDEYGVEVHLDLNPDARFVSSAVVNEAIGFIKGVCQVQPLIKPQAWAASTAADNYKRVMCA